MKEQQQQSVDKLSENGARRSIRDFIGIFGPLLLLTIAGLVVTWQFVEPAPPKNLVMATGSLESAYHQFGLQYSEILARHGIELELVNTAGSEIELELVNTAGSVENLELLMDPDGRVDVALLQGGIGSRETAPELQGLASLFYEPLWIFQRDQVSETVSGLIGRRVAIGEPGSGTHSAMSRLIEDNQLPVTAFEALELGGNTAADALLEGQVEIACFVASIQAPYIQRLLLGEGIHLTPVIRAEAYMRHDHSLASVVLPRGTADLRRDIPPADIQMLAPVASMTARDTLHPILAVLLMQAAVEVHSSGGIFEKQGQFPSVYNTTFPLNEAAGRYLEKGPPWLQRFLPFWVAVSIDRLLILLIPLATLLYPLFKIAPPTYRWRIRKRIYHHYRYLFGVETALMQNPSEAALDHCAAQIDAIEKELAEVSIPLSYADQLYHLRMHVRFVRQRVESARKVVST